MKRKPTKELATIVFPPETGWKPHTYYAVEVAYNPQNPIHPAIFYSGFLTKGSPAGYNAVITDEDHTPIHRLYYLRVLNELITKAALEKLAINNHAMVADVCTPTLSPPS